MWCGARNGRAPYKKRGSKLYYERDGREVEIRRIYNRAIVDELERRGISAPFDWRDDLDVEWAGHPNFYFRVSKFAIPYLRHPSVPRTIFLDRVTELPEDLAQWVLKPLYSFAGLGVVIGPAREEVDAIPAEQRGNFILQERVHFTYADFVLCDRRHALPWREVGHPTRRQIALW